MAQLTRSVRHVTDVLARVFSRGTAVIIGFILTVLGVGMTITIVMLPVGVVLGLLGVAILVAGLFGPNLRQP
jgi:hypothetical protein